MSRVTHGFAYVLTDLKEGKRIRRLKWKMMHLSIKNNIIYLTYKEDSRPWIPTQEDILALDWIVLESFEKVD